MNKSKNMGLENERNPPSITELLQYNAHSIDEEDEISYEHQNENLKTEDDDTNNTEQQSDNALTERKFLSKHSSVQVESDQLAGLNGRLNPIRLGSVSFDCLNPSSYDNSSSDISRSPSPLKLSRMGGYSPDAKRKSSRSFLKISIPIRKQSMSSSIRKTYQDKYISLEKIGQGALGEVRRCKCVNSSKEYAVKTIGFKDGEHLLNISREFFLLQSLKHPNVVKTHDFFIENKKCYIILDYVVGFSLQEFLKKHQKMSEEQTKFVIIESIKAIQYLHQKGVCHRDITSNNILIDEKKNSIKLIDFSNSKSCDSRRMMTKTGTLSFMAPEIFTEQEYDKQVDLWSIGVVMFQLLTGQLPFFSESELGLIQDIQKKELNISEENPLLVNISSKGIDFLSQLLQKNPRKRLTSSQALSHPWLKQVNLMCSFKKVSKRGSGFSSKSPNSSEQHLLRQIITQELVQDFQITLEKQDSLKKESHQTLHNLSMDGQILLGCQMKQVMSHNNLDTSAAIENIDPNSYDDLIKSNQVCSCEDSSQACNNKTECCSNCSPRVIPIPSNPTPEKHSILAPCNRYTNTSNPYPQSPPQTSASAQKFSNNNDTNFNSKILTDQCILDIRKRSRSSIYYSQIQS